MACPWISFIYAVFACGLIVSTFIDIRWRIIPDEISLGGIVVGLVFALIKGRLVDSFLGVIIGGGLVYGSGLLGNLIFFKLMKKKSIEGETESIGRRGCQAPGDDRRLYRLESRDFDLFTAPFMGAAVGIYVLAFKKSHLIPYGPFLSLAALISLFYGNHILRFLFGYQF